MLRKVCSASKPFLPSCISRARDHSPCVTCAQHRWITLLPHRAACSPQIFSNECSVGCKRKRMPLYITYSWKQCCLKPCTSIMGLQTRNTAVFDDFTLGQVVEIYATHYMLANRDYMLCHTATYLCTHTLLFRTLRQFKKACIFTTWWILLHHL